MKRYNYKFYPSLLDAFSEYLSCELLYGKIFGEREATPSFKEFEEGVLQELLNKINRVPFSNVAVDRGSVLNEVVDCIVMHCKSTRSDISLQSIPLYGDTGKGCVFGKKGEHEFVFDIDFCKNLAKYFQGSICQVYTEAPIETKYGNVLLYGFPDYIRLDRVYDLKTTSRYEFGKYKKYWQRHAYPYALTESGKCNDIRAFEFTAVQIKGGTEKMPLIYGEIHPEVYVYDHGYSTMQLRGICEQFIEFLENNRPLITDTKIFGGERE